MNDSPRSAFGPQDDCTAPEPFGVAEFEAIGDMIADVLEGLRDHGEHGDAAVEANVRERVSALCARFPIYEG